METSLAIIGLLLIILVYFTALIPRHSHNNTVYIKDHSPIHSRFFIPYKINHPLIYHKKHLRFYRHPH